MDESGGVTRALLAIIGDGADDRELAERICRTCIAWLDVDGASISFLTGSTARETIAATDATALLLEDLQFSVNEGPCMQAAASGDPVLVPDLCASTDAARWPVFAAAVAERTEARALFALPLRWGVTSLGVLDLYRIGPGELSPEQCRDALSAADTAALMMLGVHTDPGGGESGIGAAAWLVPGLSSRAEIHQATGMVVVQLGISTTEALARLRGYAFAHQCLLLDAGRDVVAGRLVFTEDMA